jgi:hypothetical protein
MTKDPCCPWHDALASTTMTLLHLRHTGAAGALRLHVWVHTSPFCTLTTRA